MSDTQTRDRIALLIQVARMYYEDRRRQDEIAEAIGYSRPTVSRLLDEARLSGIVRFQVGHPLERTIMLEQDLRSRFPDVRFHIAEDHVTARVGRPVIRLAASLLADVMGEHREIGVSSGRTLADVVAEAMHLPLIPSRDLTFVQLIGSTAPGSDAVDGADLCQQFASVFGGRIHRLPAPLVARDLNAARMFREDATITEAMDRARAVDLAVVGIGRFMVRNVRDDILHGWTDVSARREAARHGAVCHLLGQFADKDGNPIDTAINRRVIGITLDELRKIPRVIAVATGAEKAPAILASLIGGYYDDLVVDYSTATRVLALAKAG